MQQLKSIIRMRTVALITLTILFSCQSSKSGETDLKALKDEVFEIHDEVMPKMGDLRRARKDLMLQADSIKASDSVRAITLIAASDKIAAANESMMDWMRNFDPNFEGSDQEIENYLNEKKASISQVREDMLGSLEEGKNLLKEDLVFQVFLVLNQIAVRVLFFLQVVLF